MSLPINKSLVLLLSLCVIDCKGANSGDSSIDDRIEAAKLKLWSRGAFALDETALFGNDPIEQLEQLEEQVAWASVRLGPVRATRRIPNDQCFGSQCLSLIRGGAATDHVPNIDVKIEQLGKELGSEFLDAIAQVSSARTRRWS